MGDTFGNRARKFMGWYSPEDIESDEDQFGAFGNAVETENVDMDVVSPLRRETDRPRAAAEPPADLSRIVTVHPGSYNDVLPIGEAFRKGVPVIINLTDMSEAEARRVIDFAAGLIFGLHGVIERVTNRVFLLSPRSVEVSGDITGARRGALFNQG